MKKVVFSAVFPPYPACAPSFSSCTAAAAVVVAACSDAVAIGNTPPVLGTSASAGYTGEGRGAPVGVATDRVGVVCTCEGTEHCHNAEDTVLPLEGCTEVGTGRGIEAGVDLPSPSSSDSGPPLPIRRKLAAVVAWSRRAVEWRTVTMMPQET